MQVCYTAVLIQCGNQFADGLIRECYSLPVRTGKAADGSLKLGVLERFWLEVLIASGLWAAFSIA